jgi:hypothetical protein
MAKKNAAKAETVTTKPEVKKKMEMVRPKDGMAYVYSNHVQLGQSTSDVRILFGEFTDVNDERIEVTQRVQVTMAWLQTKFFAEFLTNQVKLFEERNGPIQTEFAKLENAPPPSFPKIVEKQS